MTAATGPTPKQSTPFNQLSHERKLELSASAGKALFIRVMRDLASLNLNSAAVTDAEKQRNVSHLTETLKPAMQDFAEFKDKELVRSLARSVNSLKAKIKDERPEMFQVITNQALAAKFQVNFDKMLLCMIIDTFELKSN